MESVLVAIITGGLTFLGSIYASKKQYDQHSTAIVDEFKTELAVLKVEISNIRKDINNLEKKQDKHNDVITRTFKLEQDVELLKDRQKVANHRIDDLEHDVKNK